VFLSPSLHIRVTQEVVVYRKSFVFVSVTHYTSRFENSWSRSISYLDESQPVDNIGAVTPVTFSSAFFTKHIQNVHRINSEILMQDGYIQSSAIACFFRYTWRDRSSKLVVMWLRTSTRCDLSRWIIRRPARDCIATYSRFKVFRFPTATARKY
jgi:hypothetical protein